MKTVAHSVCLVISKNHLDLTSPLKYGQHQIKFKLDLTGVQVLSINRAQCLLQIVILGAEKLTIQQIVTGCQNRVYNGNVADFLAGSEKLYL